MQRLTCVVFISFAHYYGKTPCQPCARGQPRLRWCTSLVLRPMIVVFGLGTRLRVRMRTTLENDVLHNGQQPQRVVLIEVCDIRSRDNTVSADVQRCAAAFRSTAAASAPLRPLPLYCGRFRSLAAALRTTTAALCRSPTVFGVCSAAECTYGPPYITDYSTQAFTY